MFLPGKRVAVFGKTPYSAKVLATDSANLIGYWKLNEPVGATTVLDYSANGNNGTASNVTFGAAGMGDGQTSATFDASNSYIDISSISGEFVHTACTISTWFYSNSYAAGQKTMVWLRATDNNLLGVWVNGAAAFHRHGAGGTFDTSSTVSVSAARQALWNHTAFTINKAGDAAICYLNGVAIETLSTLGVWSGTLAAATTCIGSTSTTPASVWNGRMAHVAIWKSIVSPGDIAKLAVI